MSRFACVLAALACMLALSASALVLNSNLDADAIRKQQQQIRSEAEAKRGRYKDMEQPRLTELFAHQDKVDDLLTSVDDTADLPEKGRMELFNALEAIEAIVNAAEDERMVCERIKPTGSHRPVRECKTVAQRRAEREDAMRDMGSRSRGCSSPVCTR